MEENLELELLHPRYDVVVIGGGAAGLMAAGTAARVGNKVLLLEKMEKPYEWNLFLWGKRNILYYN